MYDIRKTHDFGTPKAQWGREYYAKDGMGMYVPVLFVPYFEWGQAGRFVPNWDRAGSKPVRKGQRYVSHGEVFFAGVKRVWEDVSRILKKEWYCDA